MSRNISPEVTVMMPVYNSVDFVDAAVLSVLAQDHGDWDLLIYDDCSTDGTYERLSFWAAQDERISVARPFESHGQYVAICNQLIADANGTYLARLDADDISLPKRLSTELQFLKQRAAVLVGSMALCIMMDRQDNSLTSDFPWLQKIVEPVASAEQPVNEALRTYNRFVHSSILARKSDVVAAGGYEDIVPLEDWDLELKLAAMGAVYVLPDILTLKRQHPNNYTKAPHGVRTKLLVLQEKHGLQLEGFKLGSEL